MTWSFPSLPSHLASAHDSTMILLLLKLSKLKWAFQIQLSGLQQIVRQKADCQRHLGLVLYIISACHAVMKTPLALGYIGWLGSLVYKNHSTM